MAAVVIKPEPYKKRAEDFIAAGNVDDAINTLYEVISSKKFRMQQVSTGLEELMTLFFKLCIEYNRLEQAKFAVVQYRNLCNESNDPSSLEKVTTYLRDAARERCISFIKQHPNVDLDSEPIATAEDIINAAFCFDTIPVTESSAAIEVHQALKFFWEITRAVLEITFRLKAFEEVYHTTAFLAIEFCVEFKRSADLRRLCDALRNHYASIQKGCSTLPRDASHVDYQNPKAFLRLVDLRFKQFHASMDLSLYKEAYAICDDIHNLLASVRQPLPQIRADALGNLAEVLLKARGGALMHATASLRLISHIRQFRVGRDLVGAELSSMATKATLAVLAIPYVQVPPSLSLEVTAEELQSARQTAWQSVMELSAVPSRARLVSDLKASVLTHASPVAAKLFNLLEDGASHPVSCCSEVSRLINELPADLAAIYGPPLRSSALVIVLKSLSVLFKSVSVEKILSRYCPANFLSADEVIRSLTSLCKSSAIPATFNAAARMVNFDSTVGAASGESFIARIATAGRSVNAALDMIFQQDSADANRAYIDEERQQIYRVRVRRLEEDAAIITRREEAMRQRARLRAEERTRKEENVRRAAEETKREEDEKLRKQAENDAKQREQLRIQQEKETADRTRRDELLKEVRDRLARGTAVVRLVELKGVSRKLDELTVDDVSDMTTEQLEKFVDEQATRERRERVKIRKADARRVDHLVRALREENAKLLATFEDKQRAKDLARAAEWKENVEAKNKEKCERLIMLQSHLKNVHADIQKWKQEHQ